jgi:hypothetical protein
MSTRSELVRLFSEGKVPGEHGIPTHIETVISDVFLFKTKAYKLCKDANPHADMTACDLSEKNARFAFVKEDFAWNNSICSETYLLVAGIRAENGRIKFVPDEEADDLVWVMKRLPDFHMLYTLLRGDDLYTDDYLKMGRLFAQRENAFTYLKETPAVSVLSLARADCDDTDAWGKSTPEIDSTEWKTWMQALRSLAEEVLAEDQRPPKPAFDMVSLNAFYMGRSFLPLDTHPWKEAWRFRGTHTNAYRLAADIWAFTGEKNADLFLKGYGEMTGRGALEKKDRLFWILFGALIMLPYLYKLGRTDPEKKEAAEHYATFVRTLVA